MMIYATEDTFDDLIQHPIVVVDFFPDWCGPCHMLTPTLNRLAKSMNDVRFIQVDTEIYTMLSESTDVKSLPTLCLYHNGVEVDRILGYVSDYEFSTRINALKEKNHV